MEKINFMDNYPVWSKKLNKTDISFKTTDELISYFKDRIEQDSIAQFISIFDHYSHTKKLEQGEINPDIINAKNIIFCFGVKIPVPQVLAVRPRSIGVTELSDHFIISTLEPPVPLAKERIQEWVDGIS